MSDQNVSSHFAESIAKAELMLDTMRGDYPAAGLLQAWQAQSQALLESVAGPNHSYTIAYARIFGYNGRQIIQTGLEILRSAADDFSKGRLRTLKELVHADMFADFLEMADYLMGEEHGYKDAAAVIAGSVLESHLRELCKKHNIDVEIQRPDGSTEPKKSARLNDDLYRESVYGLNDQKHVTAWLGIRNDAAHGHYDRYVKDQVRNMIDGIRSFVKHHPA